MIEAQGSTEILFGNTGTKKSGLHSGTQADSPIKFSQLSKANDLASAGDIFELGLSQALGTSKKESAADFSSSKLSKVTQLTGFSDPIYAEAYVHVHQYDIVLDVLIGKQSGPNPQCGNFSIFPPLRFYVKSILLDFRSSKNSHFVYISRFEI